MSTYRQRLKEVTVAARQPVRGHRPARPRCCRPGVCRSRRPGWRPTAARIVDALGDTVAVFKPQSAFFEVYGSAGVAVLERVLADIRAAGALSIVDAKRGDIGSTMEAYAEAYLARTHRWPATR